MTPRFIAQYDPRAKRWRVVCLLTGLYTPSANDRRRADALAAACELYHSLIERECEPIRYPCPVCSAQGMMPNGEACPRCSGAGYDFQTVVEHDAAYARQEG